MNYDYLGDSLTKECLNNLLRVSQCQEFKQGETLFLEHSFCDSVYFIISGNVTVYKDNSDGRRKIIYLLGENSFLNDTMIYDDLNKTSISCDAFTDVKVLIIPLKELRILLSKYPDLSILIIKSLSKKTKRLYRQLKNTTTISMDKRIAAKLWKLAKDFGYEHKEFHGFTVKVNNTYLADMLGTNRETVSRGIKKLKELGLVKVENNQIFILKSKMKDFYRR
ncbi:MULTISPECIES: Crp/Fnr family transcriptional regulator [Cetobacterium]|jgi:CRP-like cAMP-binding protein|uniref:Crp/Fnr family transcriptional regulator n=1 Tax=Candidatus Cetobacterium colombiensis TaxID=3073100 RepID=A0ABU4W609_9FUSO|nr:Crp/Fnr family transcriptional regulator [Candidatus Cetobacterium colombiensis]MDX8334962.1 Crp/Fnr family transcriptional regulator [Candidatus Cetobacterium colombiensis]